MSLLTALNAANYSSSGTGALEKTAMPIISTQRSSRLSSFARLLLIGAAVTLCLAIITRAVGGQTNEDDHGDTIGTATSLSLGSFMEARIDPGDDQDMFKLELTESTSLFIYALSRSLASLDAVILDSGSTEISTNAYILRYSGRPLFVIEDDFGPGIYYVRISTQSDDTSGYRIGVFEDTNYTDFIDRCENARRSSQINDPLYGCQWHLQSREVEDINVEPVWANGIMGEGINVAVVDTTVDYSHEDLASNINSSLSHDYGGREGAYRPFDHHGTYVAGVIAARDNGTGVRGVAPRATIYGYNLLADFEEWFSDLNAADAMARNRNVTAVSNNSWGPPDDAGLGSASSFWEAAIETGISAGYGGKGVFYAWAGGNGHEEGDDSNLDELANFYGVTAVCAVSDSDTRSFYSETGANLWICAPSNGGSEGIVTTENSDRYYSSFGGTSSAAPTVAGVAALMRDANPDLTWRDLKLILASSARKNDAGSTGWKDGAAKYRAESDTDRYQFNHEYGFGVVDAKAAVDLAKVWTSLPPLESSTESSGSLNLSVPDSPTTGDSTTIESSLTMNTSISFVEFVEINVTFDHASFRDLEIELVSPSGAISKLVGHFNTIDYVPLRGAFRFGSARHLGENPNGEWRLRLTDHIRDNSGTLDSWSIKVFGHEGPPGHPTVNTVSPGVESLTPAWTAPTSTGGSAITAYDLRHIETSADETVESNWTVVEDVWTAGSGALKYTTTGLIGGTQYDLQLRAVNAVGNGPWSATVVGTPDEAPTANPDLVVDTPTVSNSTPMAGADFTLSAAVGNEGNGLSESTTLRYYRSTDDTITTGDTEVGTDTVGALDASASSDQSVDLTAPSDPGTYYFGACVDTVSDESDTSNNCSEAVTVAVVAPPTPDLVVDMPSVSNSSPTAGASFMLSATVGNQGNGSSGSTTLRYYRSTDSTITTDDFEVGTDTVGALDASASSDQSVDLTAPSDPGTYYFGACVETVSDESDTSNNCSAAVKVEVGAPPIPDLVVDTPTVNDSNPEAGGSFTLSATVSNEGNGPSVSTTLRYYRSSDTTITTGDTEEGTDTVGALDASESSNQSVDLTAPDSPGTYYYGACVDTVTEESDMSNNCSGAVTVTVGAPPTPDLVVDPPTVSDSSPTAGESFTLSVTVSNEGNGSSGSSTLRYYRSTDSTITTGDTEEGTDEVGSLNPSGSSDESISLTAPDSPGTYYYGACVDTVSDESDTSNNCSAAVTVMASAPAAPDLVVDTPTVSDSSPTAGESFTLSVKVSNEGNGPSVSTTLRYYRSSDSTITTGDTEVGTDDVGSLNSSGSSDESISLTAPDSPGTYYYGACVDTVSDESDTSNNCSAAVTVMASAPAAPDLVVDTPTVSDSNPEAGGSFTLSVTVRNQGNGSSGSSTLYYYRSTDSRITTGDIELGTDSVGALGASASSNQSIALIAPSDPGTYYYGACVDTVSDESDTSNNCSAATAVAVGSATAPDLVVDPPTVSDGSPTAGARFTLSVAVRNQGTDRSSFTTLRYYRSTDSTITSSDTEVGTDSVFGLDASESGDESINLTAPDTPGTYYYGACVDALADESNVANNCSSAVTVNVGPAPVPDLVVGTPTVSDSGPLAGARFSLSVAVRNQGTGRSSFTTLRYYRSTDSTITSSDTEVGTDSVFGLDASESGDESINLTAPDTAGTYYYGACVDALAGESNTGNNCSAAVTVTVGPAPMPDLVVGTPSVSDGSPTAGARFTLSVAVRNQGTGRSSFTTLRYYRSTDSTITNSDTEVGADSVFGLDASESGDESINLTAPDTPGTYYYGACVDAVADESNTGNNCSAAVTVTVGPAPMPDLVVETPAVSDGSPAAGRRFTLSATVHNQGTGRSRLTTLRYYRSTDSTITSSDTEEGTDLVSSLDPSESGDESISLTAPDTPGTYYYGACVDAVADESNTGNNCSAAVTVTVGPAPVPDLVLGTPTVSESSPTAGARFTLNVAVHNQGTGRSRLTTLRYYRSTDSTITSSDSEEGTDLVSSLDPSESGDESIRLTAPDTPGTYYYGACVDAVADESNTGNNCSAAVTVTVGPAPMPDLVVETPAVSDGSPAAGRRFTLSATVHNQGTGRSRLTTLRYYRSTDSTITSSDTEEGTDLVSSLDPSESGDESISLTAPDTPGTYYYGACVDGVFDESSTGNNCSAAVAIAVGAVPSNPANQQYSWEGSAIVVSWDAVAGADHYNLYYDDFSDSGCSLSSSGRLTFCEELTTNVAGTSFTHSNPDSDSNYYWVTACNSAGCSDIDGDHPARLVGPTPIPDLVVGTLAVNNSSPDAGARFALSATVRNQGHRRSLHTTLHYYRSTDSTITSSDTEEGTDFVSSLDPSEGSDESFRLAAPSTAGTYYYGACVEEVSDETDTGNNCSEAVRVNVGLAPVPDLVVGTPTVSDERPDAGVKFTLSATVHNEGGGESFLTTLHYYRSEDSTITTSDTFEGTDLVGSLDPAGSSDESISLTAPTIEGTYYYGACVEEVSDETDASNNCSSAATVTIGTGSCVAAVADPNNEGLVSDCEALLAARDVLAGTATLNWSSDTPIADWDGIGDDSLQGSPTRVTQLYLNGLGLDGTVPNELSNLSALKVLHLHDNELTGTIPSSLGDLSNLIYLYVHNNDLTDSIPVALGELTSLKRLFLHSNDLTGNIPVELGKLTRLTHLWLKDNDLTGEIPPELGNMSSLDWLHIAENDISGEIPAELGALTKLRRLYVYENDLSGSMPGELGNLTRLTHIAAQENDLNGEIPEELGNLTNLVWLGLYDNDLEGEIPEEMGGLAKLQRLYLHHNELRGEIPEELGELSAMTNLWLNHNYLSGQIPQSLGELTKLTRLRLAGNDFMGCLPAGLAAVSNSDADQLGLETCSDTTSSAASDAEDRVTSGERDGLLSYAVNQTPASTIDCSSGSAVTDAANNPELVSDCETLLAARDVLAGTANLNWSVDTPMPDWDGIGDDSLQGSPTRVTRLYLNGLGLDGTVPNELSNLSALEVLHLHDNELTGTIPSSLGDLSNLIYLYVHNNDLTDSIPVALGELTSLKRLFLHSNNLTGNIPAELGKLTRLTHLGLKDNDLTGEIPPELGNMSSLDWLHIAENDISGEIPAELGALTKLRRLYVYENDLSGSMPAELGNLTRMTHIVAQENDLSGEIPEELGNLTNLVWLGLYDNDLKGEILASMGGLAKLQRLYLHHNELRGEIPEELGELSAMTNLWLNHNYLSGQIPQSLGELTKLTRVRLAGNDFTGCLPAGLAAVSNSDADQLGLDVCGDS